MAANEFEKNARKSLDEFKLHPAEEVWQKVEERIREKKRRRVIFFIIFSLFGLALGGYGIYNLSDDQKLAPEVREPKSNETVQGTRHKAQETSNSKNPQAKNNTIKTNVSREMKINKRPPINKTPYNKEVAARSLSENVKGKNRLVVTALKKYKKEQEKKPTNDTAHQNIPSNISLSNNQQNLIDTISQKPASTSTGKDIAKNDPGDTISIISKENKANLPIAQVKRKKQDQVPKKLKWGLNFSAGSSIITQNRFSLKARGNSVSDSYNAPGSVTGGGGSGAGFVNAPSSNRSSFAFKAGLALKKNLTRRSSLSMSINYAYLADKIKIGTRQNVSPQGNNFNSITSYYNSIRLKTFTDHFHFIELPIMYDWRITGNLNHFISLDIGMSIAYLISTNAVVYDTISGGIYYHDKDLFNKTHINFMSGLSYHSIGKRSFEWSIEPQFSFDVTRIFKSNLDTRKYFLYTGIGATIFFEKQKKK